MLVAQARHDTRVEVTQSAQVIAELCLLAGCPERAAQFIAAGQGEAEVRLALIAARAAQSAASDIRSTILAEAGSEASHRPETSPIVAAVKKLVHKE